MEKLGIFFAALAFVFFVALVLALPTMWSWDAIMPKYFGLKEITFTDALWLNILASCLFKSSSSNNKN